MIVCRNHLWFQIDQTAEYAIQRNRICGHKHYTFVQINQHSGKAVRTRVLCVTFRFVKAIHKSITILNRTCDSLQGMSFHFT